MTTQKISSYQGGRGHLESTVWTGPFKILKLAAVGVVSMAVGIVSTMFAIQVASPQSAEPAIGTEGLISSDQVVTRAVTDDLLNLAPTLEEKSSPTETADQTCLQELGALTSVARFKVASDILQEEGSYLDHARSIALAVRGCDFVTVTVEGHASGNENEVKNLSASWRHAKTTIALLAQEGLDVSALQPLGFGSRALTNNEPIGEYISFHMVPGSAAGES